VASYCRLLAWVGQDTSIDSLVHPAYMYNWRGTIVRVLALLDPAGAPFALAAALYGLLALATLALLWQAWRGLRRPTERQLAGLWALTILSGMLISPHLHAYDLALWLLAGALIARFFGVGTATSGSGAVSAGEARAKVRAEGEASRSGVPLGLLPCGLPRAWQGLLLAAHALPTVLAALPIGQEWSAQIGAGCTLALAAALWHAMKREDMGSEGTQGHALVHDSACEAAYAGWE
jgi:hypothetical protein